MPAHEHVASILASLYVKDCWQKRPVSMALIQSEQGLQREDNPGAGMEPSAIEPYQTVLKDGFYQVDCIKDYMYYHGDKFGKNKHSYELGQISNVSVVHYTEIVPREDRHAMTHTTCFEFCRTVPDMSFFGIANGRDCYCTPYFQAMAGDDSLCHEVCEGDQAAMCGGKSKSSVFQMHMCDSTQHNVLVASEKIGEALPYMASRISLANRLAANMQEVAAGLQSRLGAAGDSAASDLMQSAKTFAGKIEKTSNDTDKLKGEMTKLQSDAGNLVHTDEQASVVAAEKLTSEMETTISAGQAAVQSLDQLIELASRDPSSSNALQYVSVMHFVDKAFVNESTTCGGRATKKPLIDVTVDGCAAACDADVHSCTGFAFYPNLPSFTGLCFLFSQVETVTYYVGCDQGSDVLASCLVKLSEFEGGTLTPDPSGKCKQCLNKVAKADRCF